MDIKFKALFFTCRQRKQNCVEIRNFL